MLFFHFLITNYETDDDHPVWHAIVHWLACFACTVAFWMVAFIGLMLLGVAIGQ